MKISELLNNRSSKGILLKADSYFVKPQLTVYYGSRSDVKINSNLALLSDFLDIKNEGTKEEEVTVKASSKDVLFKYHINKFEFIRAQKLLLRYDFNNKRQQKSKKIN